ncbi:hypothetical protein NMG46_11170 [Mesorhizobium sp. LMG 17147]|uniref:hypothetical protein n=1 Tax=Mesorhizobium sp. LMG 17147 TaxID=2963091 RepID=UPI0020C99606|nr:hypothetical protein [Mesorhizobium sp. LMG 17147]MCP9230802.1 hypothetical protein [Mesorhizobium sp. LMG 17147]
MTIKNLPKWLCATSTAVFLLASIAPSHAESYSNLQGKGYKTGKLSRGASGSLGWFVSNGEKKYFCRMRAAQAYVGSTGWSLLPPPDGKSRWTGTSTKNTLDLMRPFRNCQT